MTELMRRRRALMAVGGEQKYISGNGYEYTEVMVKSFSDGAEPWKSWFTTMGAMPFLKDITFTGTWRAEANGAAFNSETMLKTLFQNAPNLEKLRFKPQALKNASQFKGVHYNFIWIPPSVTYLELGSLSSEGMPWIGGGYFRKPNTEIPDWTGGYTIGNVNGLTLAVYRTEYSAKGGFDNGNLYASTTVICYNNETGEIMTP